MRIAVMGAGGVGGYFGGRLAEAGEEVVFIARGAHREALEQRGLRIESALGDATIRPTRTVANPADAGVVDMLIFAVKLYDTEAAASALRPLFGPTTGVVTLQNGIDGMAALTRALGATHVIDPDAEELPSVLERITGQGPDVVFEAVGVPGLIQEAIGHVRFRGRLVVAGMCIAPDQIQPAQAMMKETSVFFALAYEKDDFQYTVDMIDQERIAPAVMVTDRVGLGGVEDAFQALADPDRQCKVLVHPGD